MVLEVEAVICDWELLLKILFTGDVIIGDAISNDWLFVSISCLLRCV